jgi:hypothetical protein
MTNLMNRRAALGALVALPALGVPVVTVGDDKLSDLIAAHRKAREAFNDVVDDLEAAEPDKEARVAGLAGSDYKLSLGKDCITERINEHCDSISGMIRNFAGSSPATGEELVAAVERERDAALVSVAEVFKEHDAAEQRYYDVGDVEMAALMAICGHRCASPDELARKFQYLWTYRSEILDENYQAAIFGSFLPEAQLHEA